MFAEIEAAGWARGWATEWVLIITAIFLGVTQVIAQLRIKELKEAAIETKTVALETKELVNGKVLIQLKLYAMLARKLASATNNPIDIAAAEIAEELCIEHARPKV